MGLLDDAIREHLDLKRRRGADPTEIERAEREALGPVRRGPETAGEDLAPPEPAAESLPAHSEQWNGLQEDADVHGHLPLDAGELPLHEDELPLHEDELPLHDEGLALHDEELPPHDPSAGFPRSDPLAYDSRVSDSPEAPGPAVHPADVAPYSESPAGHAPRPADSPPDTDQETEEYDQVQPEDKGDDDVLETTPEFLQDTPDHDRLWFEQRPPRDFDFDG